MRMSGSKRRGPKYHGLKNQGATCYLNSVLQVLFMTRDFREAVKRHARDRGIGRQLDSVFSDLEKHTAHTSVLTSMLGIKVREQHDAADYLEKILSLTSPEASQIFQIVLSLRSECRGCGKETKTEQQLWTLPLALQGSHSEDYEVVDAIRGFFDPSVMKADDEQIYCERCKAKAQTAIRFEMERCPEVLTLLLKRFQFDLRSGQYVKIQQRVQIPHAVTVWRRKYELYAFVDHRGGLKGGHYTVNIKSEDDDMWYHFNDAVVSRRSYQPFQSDPSYRSQGAYLLFYRKEKKTSPQDEASRPAGFTPGTPVNDDHHGNSVKGDEEAAGGRKNDLGSEGQSASEDGERELAHTKRHREETEEMREKMPSKLRKRESALRDVAGEAHDSKAAGVGSLTESFAGMNLVDSTVMQRDVSAENTQQTKATEDSDTRVAGRTKQRKAGAKHKGNKNVQVLFRYGLLSPAR